MRKNADELWKPHALFQVLGAITKLPRLSRGIILANLPKHSTLFQDVLIRGLAKTVEAACVTVDAVTIEEVRAVC